LTVILRCAAAVLGALLVASCAQSSQQAQPSTTTTAMPPPASTSTSAAAAPAPAADLGPATFTPVLANAVADPVPVLATDGKDHLAYELQLTNVLSQQVTLTSVAVVDGDRTLLSLAADSLGYWTRVIGNPTPATVIGPGQSALVWLDVAIDRPAGSETAALPKQLVHRIGISVAKPDPPLILATSVETVAPVAVQTRPPAVIAPPLRGPGWLDGNSCCDMTPHRMATNPINGKLWAAERFAIDYLQLRPDGRIYDGDQTKLESYAYFGTDIHAVADGPVVSVLDGLPEEVPGKDPAGLPLDQYSGNHIVQDIGGGNYALYAHLKTGSIKVKPGDRLTTGQVFASLGNSGNTDAPHLHFHVMSTPDPLHSDGLPFVIDQFTLDNRLTSVDTLFNGQPAPFQPGFAPRDEKQVSPLVMDVMTYADR
jgi:murein DD-endopeptidase MepM/ murein hydrolase activator NlpD